MKSRYKQAALVLLASFLHFAATVAVVVNQLSCDGPFRCHGWMAELAGNALLFPLNALSFALEYGGFDVNGAIRTHLGGAGMVLYAANSVLDIVLLWIFVALPLMRWRAKRRSDASGAP